MNIHVPILAALFLTAPLALSAQNQAQENEPVAWGALSANRSCVIFAESRKTTRRFYGVEATSKTVGELTLLEAHDYAFNQKQMIETQENMDELMRMAHNDSVKFVKIPDKHSPELLEKARASCKSEAQPPAQ